MQAQAAAIGWPVLITLLCCCAWELAVRLLGIRSIILPPPSAVFEVMVERYDLLLTHLWPSLYLTVLGFLLSVVGRHPGRRADHLFAPSCGKASIRSSWSRR